jgi:asparagine synthase (glutamine-hydrolysing)
MFAFAFVDFDARRLTLARDFFGIEPLYFTKWRDGVAFASESSLLLDLPGWRRRADQERAFEYLRFGRIDSGRSTMLAGIRSIPPGGLLEVDLDKPEHVQERRYWRVADQLRPSDLSLDEAADRLRTLFLDSVRLHLRSDVPVGAALSGGIDSSAVVMAMRQELGWQREIHAFSYIAEHQRLNEERWIDLIASTADLRVHKVRSPPNVAEALERLIRTQDQPFGGTSVLAQHCVFERAQKQGLKVTLDGQGADEFLGGYAIYAAARAASLIRSGRTLEAARLVWRAGRHTRLGTFGLALRAFQQLLPPSFVTLGRPLVGQSPYPPWLDRRHCPLWQPAPAARSSSDLLKARLIETLEDLILPELLRYADRNSMAHSIESRLPFLATDLVTFVLSLPESFIIAPDGTTKAVFRRAMAGVVPAIILQRRDKVAFETPELDWLRAANWWVESTFASEAAAAISMLDLVRLRADWRAMRAGRRPYGAYIWRALNLIRWSEIYQVTFEAGGDKGLPPWRRA